MRLFQFSVDVIVVQWSRFFLLQQLNFVAVLLVLLLVYFVQFISIDQQGMHETCLVTL